MDLELALYMMWLLGELFVFGNSSHLLQPLSSFLGFRFISSFIEKLLSDS